jgi:hypothetical protein
VNPIALWQGMPKSDRYMLVSSVIAPLVIWWFYIGRTKYGMKGMK